MSDYSVLTFNELRNMVKNGHIDSEYMSQSIYETILNGESGLDRQDILIIEFCINGLKQYDQYKDMEDVVIWGNVITAEKHNEENITLLSESKPRIRKVSPKKRVLLAAATIACAVALTSSIVAFDVLDILLYNSPQNTLIYIDDDTEGITTGNTRVYESLEDMLKNENLNILYPSQSPAGYSFTEFSVADFGTYLDVKIYSLDPYISFSVNIGGNSRVDDYNKKVNNIEYNTVINHNDLYQTDWMVGKDYYTIIVGDEAATMEIIENLKNSKEG